MIKNILNLIFIVLLFSIFISTTHAQNSSFNTDQTLTYKITSSKDALVTLVVRFNILRSDILLKEYSFTIPSHMEITNLTVTDGQNPLEVRKSNTKLSSTYTIILINSQNNISAPMISITYNQKNIINTEGFIDEIILPTFNSEDTANNTISLLMPSHYKKLLSIAKPLPFENYQSIITWKNTKIQSIQAIFGSFQRYSFALEYNLENDSIISDKKTIALIPETLFQSIYLDKINPIPKKVYVDSDGNYLAEYILNPKSNIAIKVKGFVTVYPSFQETMLPYVQNSFQKQKRYLLTANKYWKISESKLNKLPEFNTVKDIYDYIINTFTYSYDRVNSNIIRIGAHNALLLPGNVNCMEYTDTFIALSRENGIYTREIEGFGYSKNPLFRPSSEIKDILHSWPEYFDEARNIWVQVDPTWEDTSNIDYFSSFDTNHIAFAIHGKSSIDPLPAGMYKVNNIKSINIKPSQAFFKDDIKYTIYQKYLKESNKNEFKLYLEIENIGKTFLKDSALSISSNTLQITNKLHTFDLLAPYENKEFVITFSVNKSSNLIKTHSIDFLLNNTKVTIPISLTQDITLINSNFYGYGFIIIGILILIFTILKILKK